MSTLSQTKRTRCGFSVVALIHTEKENKILHTTSYIGTKLMYHGNYSPTDHFNILELQNLPMAVPDLLNTSQPDDFVALEMCNL